MIKSMDLEYTVGLMVVCMKVIGRTGNSMAKANT